jgi:hypothetical protein
MKIMTGIDLHSNNALCGLMDESGRRVLHKKLPCELPAPFPFRPTRGSDIRQNEACHPAIEGMKSSPMNLTQKESSRSRGAFRKQIPISSPRWSDCAPQPAREE